MMKWIKMMNKMYEANCWTDDGRVVISYCSEMDIVVVKVLGKYEVIELKDYTDWGVMLKIQETVREMYEAV